MDEEESAELESIFRELSVEIKLAGQPEKSSAIPFSRPAPDVEIAGKHLTLTGKFACGSRQKVVALIQSAGGLFLDKPTKATDFLVVGSFASRDWLYTDWGRKIQKALEYRIPIIPETELHRALARAQSIDTKSP